jgi:signal transduction histidine kinase
MDGSPPSSTPSERAPRASVIDARIPRAEFILAGAIALVSVLVVGLAITLSNGRALGLETRAVVTNVRAMRDDVIELGQKRTDLGFAFHAYLRGATPVRLERFESRLNDVRTVLADLRRRASADAEIDSIAAAMQALIDDELDQYEVSVYSRQARGAASPAPIDDVHDDVRIESARLHTLLNARIDQARGAEQRQRDRLDMIAVALAALSLIASALAIISLRRERNQWRLANEAAESARAAASASDLAKTRFLAAASHDMRQPLHALTLYLSALGKRVETDEARGILGKAERAAQSLSGMFATLLDLARAQAGVIKPEFTSVALAPLFDRIVAEHPGADVAAAPTTIEIRSDAALLERILRNLVSNALKHGGGRARLSVRTLNGFADIEVSDNGPGIAPEDQQRVFEEFVRLDGRASAEGLGLGLAIVQRLGELLGHPIELRSTPGDGATFIVRAPLLHGIAAPPPAVVSHAASLEGVRVLILDDDALALEAMAGALRDLGASVHTCAREVDVTAALAAGFAPRLLVMDLRIDGALAGIDIANRARAKLDPPPNVIIVTGDTGADTLGVLRASTHRWLIKPVDPAELANAASESV